MTDPATLAVSLGRPVAMGMLPLAHAQAAIAVTTVRGLRENTLQGNGTLDERLPLYDHLLALSISNHEDRRHRAQSAIKRVLKPMIAIGLPSNRLLAEAFNANADNGSPLTEEEVREVAATEVYWSLQRKRDVPRR